MGKPRICYVLPLWGGKRRYQHPEMDKDASFYARTHIRALREYKNDLTHIAAIVPDHPERIPAFHDYVHNEIGKEVAELNGPEFSLCERPNLGLSYGGFSNVFDYYTTKFDYYLFQEDDVIYPQQNFDKLWMDLLLSGGPRCGFACGWLAGAQYDNTPSPVHAGMGCGLFKTEALMEVKKWYGSLMQSKSAVYGDCERNGQIGISQRLFSLNWCAVDWRNSEYKLGFRYFDDGRIDWFGNKAGDKIILQPL